MESLHFQECPVYIANEEICRTLSENTKKGKRPRIETGARDSQVQEVSKAHVEESLQTFQKSTANTMIKTFTGFKIFGSLNFGQTKRPNK